MIFQIRITEECNLKCSHCYAINNKKSTMSASEFYDVWQECKKTPGYQYDKIEGINNTIYVSGGEPTLHSEFKKIMSHLISFFEHGELDKCSILSNGTGITEDICKMLQVHEGFRVQISIDGRKESHDKIRGSGAYEKAIVALKLLKKYQIERSIGYTAGLENSTEEDLDHVTSLIRRYASRPCNISPRVHMPNSFNILQWIKFRNEFAEREIEENYQYSHHSCCWMSSCGSERTVITINPDLTISGCPRDIVQNIHQLKDIVELNEIAFLEDRKAIDSCLKSACKDFS